MFKLGYACVAAVAALGISAAVVSRPAEALTHSGFRVAMVHSPDGRPCTFFTLEGVASADSSVLLSPWFAISKSAVGYNEMVSMLILSRTKGIPLTQVSTDGSSSCGHASVVAIVL